MGYEKNTRTLIATFADYGTACQAARELNENGVPHEAVYIDSNQKTAGAGSSGFQTGYAPGNPQYEEALSAGGSVLRCVVAEELTDTSTRILNRNGARDIETRSETAGTESAGGTLKREGVYADATLHPPEPRSAATIRGSFKRGTDSVQSGFGMTPGSGTLAGEATAGSAIQDYSHQDFTAHDYTDDFRRDFENRYSGRNDFEAMLSAYQYGARNASDERFRNMSWEQAEKQLQSGYAEGATCPWNVALPAVRYGWERAAGKR